MGDDKLNHAIDRLANALTRGERAADDTERRLATVATKTETLEADPGLAARHAALKAEAARAVEAMDRILGGNNG